MQSLKLADDQELTADDMVLARAPLGFWKRQFFLEPTKRQNDFDWTFGVLLPLVCTAADPFVFDTRFGGAGTLLGEYRTFAYALGIVSIMTMAAWLLWGQKLGVLRPFIGGLFLAGSLVSFALGIVMLPFSLIGMFFLVGFLGFTPLLSGVTFLRNGVRAINGAKTEMPSRMIFHAAILAALYALVIPWVLNS